MNGRDERSSLTAGAQRRYRRGARLLGALALGAATLTGSAATLVAPAAPAGATGTTLYATHSGSGTACSITAPCTLTNALSKVTSTTTTLDLSAGTYSGSSYTIPSASTTLLIQPKTPGSTVVLTGTKARRVLTVSGVATITHLTIETGKTSTGGDIRTTNTLVIKTSTIKNGDATSNGGDIFADHQITITSSTITGGSAVYGGDIYTTDPATVKSSTISDGKATYGGDLYVEHQMTLENSTVLGGTATTEGGDIFANKQLTAESSTVTGGTATTYGGDLYVSSTSGSVTKIESSTVSGGKAAAGDGGNIYDASHAYLAASIVARPTAGGDCAGASVPPITNDGYDIFDTSDCGVTVTTESSATAHSVVSSVIGNYLGTLGTHGGKTQTIPLRWSPTPSTSSSDPALGSIAKTTSVSVGATGSSTSYSPCNGTAQNTVKRTTTSTCNAGAFEGVTAASATLYASTTGKGSKCSTGTPCSLSTTLAYATASDIDVKLAKGTYTGAFAISKKATTLTIEPATATTTTVVLSGAKSERALTVPSGASATLDDLTIETGSAATGADVQNAGTLTLDYVTLEGGVASVDGGDLESTGTLTVESSAITGGTASVDGGDLDVKSGTASVESSTITGGKAAAGDGGDIYDAATVHLAASIVAKPTAGGSCAGTSAPPVTNDGYDVVSKTGSATSTCGVSATSASSATVHSVVSSVIANYLGTIGAHGGKTQTIPLVKTPTPATTTPDPALGSIPKSTSLSVGAATYAPCTPDAQNGATRTSTSTCDAGSFELAPKTGARGSTSSSSSGSTSSSSSGSTSGSSSSTDVSRIVSGQTASDAAALSLEAAFPAAQGRCPGTVATRPVVLATDAEYPDALSASYLAGYLGTGTLLTSSTSLSPPVTEAIESEGITRVEVVGGRFAVSPAVIHSLGDVRVHACGGATLPTRKMLDVSRISGRDEIATSRYIATAPRASYVATVDLSGAYAGRNATRGPGAYNLTAGAASTAPSGTGPLRSAIVANGVADESAATASIPSYAAHLPIVLTTPSSLSSTASDALATLRVAQVIVVGGELAVSDAVVRELESRGISVLRAAGATASATSEELAALELGSSLSNLGLGWAPTGRLYVTGATAWTAVLAATVGTGRVPVVLTRTADDVGTSLRAFLSQVAASGVGHDNHPITTLAVLGGQAAVSNAALSTLSRVVSG